jgi:hypothetical protein
VWMTIPTSNGEYRGTDYLQRQITMRFVPPIWQKVPGPSGGNLIWVHSETF